MKNKWKFYISFIIRIYEMMSIENELKKQFEELKNNSVLEKNHLHNVYTEEKLELIKVKNILFLDFIFFFFLL